MLNSLRSTLTLVRRCRNIITSCLPDSSKNAFVFEKLKPAIKDIIIHDCTFEGKMQFQCFGSKRPESKRPIFPRPGVQSWSIQIPSIQVPIVQVYRLCEQSPAFPVCPLRKFYNFNVKKQRLNYFYKFHRFLLTHVLKRRFLQSVTKFHGNLKSLFKNLPLALYNVANP